MTDEGQLSRNKGICRLTKKIVGLTFSTASLKFGQFFFWLVKKIVRTGNGFLLTDVFCKTNKILRSANRA